MANKEIEPDFFGSPDPSLGIYLNEIGQIPILTAEEEIWLAKRIEAGREAQARLEKGGMLGKKRRELEADAWAGNQARETLARHNLKLVVSIAKNYRGRGNSFLDLIQDGNLGLMRAVDGFDWRRGNKFATYATWWIRQAVSRGVETSGDTINIPSQMHQVLRGLEKEASRLAQEKRASVDIYDLARERDRQKPPGAQPATTRAVISKNVFSLDVNIRGNDGEEADTPFVDFIQGGEDPVSDAERGFLSEAVEQVLDSLTDKERLVIKARYGLDGEGGKTLQGVGNGLGVTRERVRQIQRKAIRRLRHPSHARRLHNFTNR